MGLGLGLPSLTHLADRPADADGQDELALSTRQGQTDGATIRQRTTLELNDRK